MATSVHPTDTVSASMGQKACMRDVQVDDALLHLAASHMPMCHPGRLCSHRARGRMALSGCGTSGCGASGCGASGCGTPPLVCRDHLPGRTDAVAACKAECAEQCLHFAHEVC
eukprot:36235-Chlamydomonas_euryale.AAC.7